MLPKCKVKGHEQINYRQKIIPAKSWGIASCRCPLKCGRKISENISKNIFDKFYEINTKNEQDIYLQGLIEVKNVSQRRKRQQDGKNRSQSYWHFLNIGSKKFKMCLNTFCSVHAITVDRVRRIKKIGGRNITKKKVRLLRQ
ncbi:hypothetical protein ABEB36_015086 [Hypothenemus hampei]|uniref:Uncharacterized protein n=1 Tax=Hypothenemus hampei TaxID=57062 RepID=A0ABD1E0P4_HYPHA